ncbi:MAG TPA: chromate resistance protein ChrB domain-containing protein [Blastocatellia bacterium]|nr:chromate resistance protein ChrB domain-containing protein [Blastocatellia bacterium]
MRVRWRLSRPRDENNTLLPWGHDSLLARECNTSYTEAIVTKTTAKETPSQAWVLLIHQLPPKPTNLRVRIWRKLQKLGAVVIKNSVYVLPATDKTNEDFQWLKQEIESAGGEAVVFRADAVEGATDKEIISAFRETRDEEFADITAQLDGLAGSIKEQTRGKHLSAGRLAAHETELDRLHAELERVVANDFFEAKRRGAALNAYERCQKLLRLSQTPARKSSVSPARRDALALHDYQGRRWVTRSNIHIDRLASAWLIKQFIDMRPRFYFVTEGEQIEHAIPFDMFGAEFTHHGEDCTFETMVKRFGLNHIKGLRELGEIVHDIDLKDDKFHRLEAAGLKAMIDGLSEKVSDDRKRLQQASVIFDGLFALLDKEAGKKPRKSATARRTVSRKK